MLFVDTWTNRIGTTKLYTSEPDGAIKYHKWPSRQAIDNYTSRIYLSDWMQKNCIGSTVLFAYETEEPYDLSNLTDGYSFTRIWSDRTAQGFSVLVAFDLKENMGDGGTNQRGKIGSLCNAHSTLRVISKEMHGNGLVVAVINRKEV